VNRFSIFRTAVVCSVTVVTECQTNVTVVLQLVCAAREAREKVPSMAKRAVGPWISSRYCLVNKYRDVSNLICRQPMK
jgi:hypothetical protein